MNFSRLIKGLNERYKYILSSDYISNAVSQSEDYKSIFTDPSLNLQVYNLDFEVKNIRRLSNPAYKYIFWSFGKFNLTTKTLEMTNEKLESNCVIFLDSRKTTTKYMDGYQSWDDEKRKLIMNKYPKNFVFAPYNRGTSVFTSIKQIKEKV